MHILMLVNWKINHLEKEDVTIQSPDKLIKGQKYWFCKYFPDNIKVDVMDFSKIPLIHHIEKRFLKFYIVQAFKAFIKRKKYDLILSHSAQSAVFFAFLRSVIGEKLPLHIVIDPASFNGGRDNFFELIPIKFATRSISGLIYHATIQSQYYEKHLPNLAKRARYIPFGIDVDFFAPINLPVENYVVAFGYKKRDYNTLFNAWQKLMPKDIDLNVIGVKKKKFHKILNCIPKVNFHEFVPINVLKEIIAKSLFVILPLPYYEYSYGQMSLLQSMCMGKAVIVTRTPGITDYIKDGINALGVNPYDADDLADKIKKCLSDRQLIDEVGKQARLSVLKKFSEQIMADKIFSYIKEIL
ncbi:MAG: glycosyltransferase family 4 protein [bacterium]